MLECSLQCSGESPQPLTLILFEKYRDIFSISIAILLQKYALLLAESSIYTTNLHHDTAPISIAILLQKYQDQGSLEHPQFMALLAPAGGFIAGVIA